MKFKLFAAPALALLGALPAHAAVIIRDVAVKNAGFETDRLSDGGYNTGASDWSVGGSDAVVGAIDPTAAMLSKVPDGTNVGYLNSYFFNGFEERSGFMGQTLGETVKTGTLYKMTVDVGRRLDVVSVGKWVAEIMAGNAVVASGTLSDSQIAKGGFTPLSVSFTGDAATSGMTLGLRFRSVYDATSRQQVNQVNLDNVRVTAATDPVMAAVPEPATWMMMIGGFAAVGASMRRRRHAMPMSLV